MKTKQLPQGWREVELQELVEFRKGKKVDIIKNPDKNSTAYIVIENLRGEPIKNFTNDKKGVVAEKQDILLVWDGANCGTVGSGLIGFVGSTISRLRIKSSEIEQKYLLIYLKNKFKYFNTHTTGATIPHLEKSSVLKLKIPFPEDKKLQKQIVSIIEKAGSLKKLRKQSDDLTKDYLKSVFAEMFLKKKDEFEEIELKDVCYTSSGGTPLRVKIEYWKNGTIPWIKSGDLNKNQITEVNEFITEKGLKNSSAKYIEPETVLIAMYGATAGKSSISKIKATTNQAVCAIVPKDNNTLNKIYLLHWLRADYKRIVSLSFGGGQPNISQNVIRFLKIPLPPITLQKKFAKIVERVERVKDYQKQSGDEINNLFGSLMQKAFRGEL